MSYSRIPEDSEGEKFMTQVKKMMSFPPEEEQERPSEEIQPGSSYKKPVFTVSYMPWTFIDMQRSFDYVGDNSTFQKRITALLVIQWISFSFMVNAMAYFFRSPSFECRLPLTDIYFYCSQSMACNVLENNPDFVKMIFDKGSFMTFQQTSIIEEFDMVCGRQHLAPWAQSMFFLGGFISGFIFSYISQKIGRRSVLLIVEICCIASILICALAPSFEIFVVGYFFIGFSLFGYETNVYIYIGEISAIRFRTISINMLTMVFVGTPVFLPFLGMIPTWRYAFIFFASLIMITFPFTYKCFLESPRFLVSKQCYQQARQVFREISITNQRPPYDFKLLEEIEFQNQNYIKLETQTTAADAMVTKILPPHQAKSYNYVTLFKYGSLRKNTLILMYLWMFRFFMYYGLNLALESILKSGLMLTIAISLGAFMEVMGTFGVSVMTTFLFRKYKIDIIKFALLVISTSMCIMWFVDVNKENCQNVSPFSGESVCVTLMVLVLLVLIVKFFNTVFFSGLIVYYSEVFPTPVRALGCGFTLTFGRIGTTIVPFYINYIKFRYPEKMALSFLAPLGFVAWLLCFLMPYTELEGIRQRIKEQEERQVFELIHLNRADLVRSRGTRTI